MYFRSPSQSLAHDRNLTGELCAGERAGDVRCKSFGSVWRACARRCPPPHVAPAPGCSIVTAAFYRRNIESATDERAASGSPTSSQVVVLPGGASCSGSTSFDDAGSVTLRVRGGGCDGAAGPCLLRI